MTDPHDNVDSTRHCPSCGNALPANAPAGLCPACLMKQGLADDSEAITQEEPAHGRPIAGATWLASETPGNPLRSGGRFVPPSVEELAGEFPQLEILELLGQGGMGAVYKARQRDLDRMIALKILPPDTGDGETFAQRFSREAKALAKLNHPNIVMVHEFGRTPTGLYFFIMEYVEGLNLRQLLRDHKLEPAEALAIVPQICEALQFAHEEGVVHRDIKPENILIDKKGRVKIADFGLAKMVATSSDDITLTREGGMMGTPQYMAPEQLEGAKHVDHRADIYSLGVVFYELLTGELPLGRFDPPSRRVQLDVRLDEVVMRTLEKEPSRRYQHAREVKTQVETIGGLTPQQFEGVKQAMGREYKSKATLFGIPLVHVATGIDPQTGKKRIARGIIALGDVAVGVFAAGGCAVGGVTFGGMSFGLLSLGGLAVGLLAAIGGLAVGSFAFGGVAVGGVAIGGAAIGYYAFGGGAWGQYVASGGHADAEAKAYFQGWAEHWPKWLAVIGVAVPVGCITVGTLIGLALRSGSSTSGWDDHDSHGRGSAKRSTDGQPESESSASAAAEGDRPRIVPILGICNLMVGVLLLAMGTFMLLPADETDRLVTLEREAMPFPEVSQVYDNVIAPVYFTCTVAFFIAGIGLLLYQPWARKVTIAVCLFQLLMMTIDVPIMLLTYVVPSFKLASNAEYRALMDFADEPAAITFAAGMTAFIAVSLLVVLIYPIAQILILNRPRIVKAMSGERSEPREHNPPSDDKSGFVCAILALVCLVLGLIGPAILLGVVDESNRMQVVSVTFVVGMLLAFVFGLIGRRFRMGRWSAGLAFVIGLGMFSTMFTWTSGVEPNNPLPVHDVIQRQGEVSLPVVERSKLELRVAAVPSAAGVTFYAPATANHAFYKMELAEHGPTALHRQSSQFRWCELLIEPVVTDTYLIVGQWDGRKFVLLSNEVRFMLLGGHPLDAPPQLDGPESKWTVTSATKYQDPNDAARFRVKVAMDPPTALENLTESTVRHRLALVMDGKVLGFVPQPKQVKDGQLAFEGLTDTEASVMIEALTTGMWK